jgi:ketosteroid isomerase-like protein
VDSGHPYVDVARRLTEAFAARDRSTIEELIAEECIWRVPGDNVLSGVYVGRPAVLELFGRIRSLFDGPIQFDVLDIAVGDRGAAVYQYASGTVSGRPVRMKECLVYTIVDGRVVELDEFQFDLRSFDEAFARRSA